MEADNKYRVVLDTNQIVAAGSNWLCGHPSRCPATPLQRFIDCIAREHTGLYSEEIMAEYTEILKRRKHPKERITQYVGCIREDFERVTVTSTDCSPPPSDPKDVMFVLCALDGQANYLVTDDKDLLRIKNGYEQPAIVKLIEIQERFLP